MNAIINVLETPVSDDSIIKKDYHTYSPYLQSFNNNDEIRISIQNQDLFLLPNESYIYVEGYIKGKNDSIAATTFKMVNNIAPYFFDEIRYEVNGIEIDRTRYLGMTSTIKNFVSLNPVEGNMLQNASWNNGERIDVKKELFNFYIPLKTLLGFAEDFNKIILNCKHELILLRCKNDIDLLRGTTIDGAKLTITNISWRIPHVHLSDSSKLSMIKIIKSGTTLPLAFRSWDSHYNPLLTVGTNHMWNVKLAANRERPRFLLMVLNKGEKLMNCYLSNIKVHLNSESYPYDDLNLDIEKGRYAILYEMYAKFQEMYYMKEPQPLFTSADFILKAPVIVIDLRYQNEGLTSGPIDVKIEFETKSNIPENTSAYCVLIHDRLVEYTPLTGLVRKIV